MRVYYYFDPEKKGDDAVKGNFDVLEDILQNRRIKISRISLLNDPFDAQMGFSQDVSRSDVENFRNEFSVIDKVLGIISFSECVDNVLMWSHYARKHMGFALELDVEEKLLTRVKYSSEAPRVARWIYAETVAKSSRCAEGDLFQIPDAPVVELVQTA